MEDNKGFYDRIKDETAAAVSELIAVSGIKKGDILVIGCSTSEVAGGTIGKNSSAEAASAIYDAVAPLLAENGIFLAAQCCEHLNRALIVERECAERYALTEVCVRPMPHAGGSWATHVYESMAEPIPVEHISAHAGLDIGGTLIGMHLRHVAVPVRLSQKSIGCAAILAARTRPKLIGGARAVYPDGFQR